VLRIALSVLVEIGRRDVGDLMGVLNRGTLHRKSWAMGVMGELCV
jgi:hypothetical protein